MITKSGRRKGFYRLGAALLTCVIPALLAGAIAAQRLANNEGGARNSPAQAKSMQSSHQEDEGERAFATNCSRCHTAPDGFSQRISGAVVRHMRVRASLSKQDEKALLRFFNP